MSKSDINPEIAEKIKALEEKYKATGQDLSSYLDGLLYADYLRYWDYIQTDTLLSLQHARTNFPDELIFIIYHQTTELYFKMILSEMKQLSDGEGIDGEEFLKRMKRINRYFNVLIDSFDVMVEGMDPVQFMKFRMALLPASGFQSAQYREIEIAATDLINIVNIEHREKLRDGGSVEEMFEHIYWKQGATELKTGAKTLTLMHFEEKYGEMLLNRAQKFKDSNLWQVYQRLQPDADLREEIIKAMRAFDVNVNVRWPLMHYKSAVRYLQKDPEVIAATGGTNWQKYLAPKMQKRIFYPALWSMEEIETWGMSKSLMNFAD
jgi:tryptophan 2,3-dioxygenase